MVEQKAIAIPRQWGLRAFADAIEDTLRELATERWDSRIFQLGPGGLLILASRPQRVELPGSDASISPDWMDEAGDSDADGDDLEPATREMLDKIFDLVGPVPLEGALDAMPSAVRGVTRLYPVRFLEDAWSELRRHHEAHVATHDASEEFCEYAQVVAAVLDAMRASFRARVS